MRELLKFPRNGFLKIMILESILRVPSPFLANLDGERIREVSQKEKENEREKRRKKKENLLILFLYS